MNYNQITSILSNDEVNYINDCEVFFNQNKIDTSNMKHFRSKSQYEFVLFEYTIENWKNTLNTLDKNQVEYSVHTDQEDQDYILI